MNIFVVIYCQLQVVNAQFNLYHTDRSLMMSVFGYDCLYYHQDEPFDLCLQMESNECDAEKEFRCQNGMCIPISMMHRAGGGVGACFDRTDVTELYIGDSLIYLGKLCLDYPSIECDSINHGWKKFSCNNGQYISYADITSKQDQIGHTCANNRHRMYLKQLFSVTNENQCWKAMICLIGFDYLYPHINCSHQNIEEWCPNEYYFPPNSVVYSFVFFLYDKLNRVNWIDSPGPDYICYNNEYCQTNNFPFSTIIKDNLRCFSVNQRMFSWQNFYEYVTHVFSSCFHTFSSDMINNRMFYRCDLSNTYISIYRVKNKRKDCYFNEDERSSINLCSLKTNDQFRCLTNMNECVRQTFLNDNEYDCLDGSDEYFYPRIERCTNLECDFRPWSKKNLAEIYRFNELCDNIVNRHVFSLNSSETDETDCEHWPYPCNSVHTKCNRVWNCPNGRDEFSCGERSFNMITQKALRCKSNEHYCIQLVGRDVNATCISMNRTGDGIIDCIGGTDERLTSLCLKHYPYDFKKRFLCLNSTVCIAADQVCNKIIDCPFGDDEHICPWLVQSSSSTFSCNSTLIHSVVRCNLSSKNNQYCPIREHLWFCDLELEGQITPQTPEIAYEPYPPMDSTTQFIPTGKSDQRVMLMSKERKLSLCNLGHLVRSSTTNDQWYCFCPPSYYGEYCQYQSEHLLVALKIQIAYVMDKSTVFRLILYLVNENDRIISHEETVYDREKIDFGLVYVVHLMYERVTNLSLHQRSKSRSVRLDSYIIKPTSVHYIASWLFHLSFPFLPVNKLAAEVSLRNELFRIMNCKKRCGSHGRCMYYVNMRHVEYCWCEQGWSGDRCEVKSPSGLCNERSCAAHAQCVIMNEEKKQMKCICPLGRSGYECYIKYNACENVQCQNNGTCLSLDQQGLEFRCACEDDYEGKYCENTRRYSFISIDANVTDLSIIPGIIVILGQQFQNKFLQKYRVLHRNIPLPTTLKITARGQFGLVQMFHNWSTSFYYAAVIRETQNSVPYFNTSVITKNRCKNVSEIFNQTILHKYSYLKRLKLYHIPCRHDHDLRCFFDEYRMCICTQSHNSNCHIFNHERGNCDYCQNDGVTTNWRSSLTAALGMMFICYFTSPECVYFE